MDYANLAVIVLLVALNLFCAWVVFRGGAEWLEGPLLSGLFGAMYTRRFASAELPASVIKTAVVVFWCFEIVCVIIAVIVALR